MLDRTTLDLLAVALEYPRAEAPAATRDVAAALHGGPLASALDRLAVWMAEDGQRAEEHYTRLFDLSPACTLHVGYHLYGEDYQRGAMLALLRGELRQRGIDEKNDLPDFLPTLLRLLGRLDDAEDRSLLVGGLVLPALAKMQGSLQEQDDPYAVVLREIGPVLEAEEIATLAGAQADAPKPVVRLPCSI